MMGRRATNRSFPVIVSIAVLALLMGPLRACASGLVHLTQGALKVGVQGVQNTFDAMRVDEVRPAQHSDFGGRVELAYVALPRLEIVVSGYRGVSHFDFDTAFEKGEGRDSDWNIDIGPNFLLGKARSATILLGGMLFYGEARSRTSVAIGPSGAGGTFISEGPRTFMLGGAARLVGSIRMHHRVEGILQLTSGVMQARGHARPSGDLYEWNGRVFSAALGLRFSVLPGED